MSEPTAHSKSPQVEGPSHDAGISDLHPIELTAHALLSGPLESLQENFEQLNQSQYILYTRLKLIEDRLAKFDAAFCHGELSVSDEDVQGAFNKVVELKKSLMKSLRTLNKVSERVDRMMHALSIEE